MTEAANGIGAAAGDGGKAASELLSVVYQELRRLAAYKLANEVPGQTLQPTALVHEAWLRLTGKNNEAPFQNRAHFFGAAGAPHLAILLAPGSIESWRHVNKNSAQSIYIIIC